MPTLHYATGVHSALTKLGLSATTTSLLPRLLHRGAVGAGVGALTSGMAGGGLLSGAALGAAGGMAMGGVRPTRQVALTERAQALAPARMERLQQYLIEHPTTPMARELSERALSKDIALGGLGGIAGGAANRALNGPT